jgi:hypothetical protein
MNKFRATFLIRQSRYRYSAQLPYSIFIPFRFRQLAFHRVVWDFRASRRVQNRCMVFALSSSESSVFSHVIGMAGGRGSWTGKQYRARKQAVYSVRVNKWLSRAPSSSRARYSVQPLLVSRIFSRSLVSVKIRAANTIRARATNPGTVHLMTLTVESASPIVG